MACPENSVYIIQGEVNLLVTAMRRSSRWLSHLQQQDGDQDPLVYSFSTLKEMLHMVAGVEDLSPNEFLTPFLDVIRSEDTTGPITGMALSSINKFLSYGFIDGAGKASMSAIENIADAVTHARFVGTDPSSDEVVLMKILHVLRTLLLTAAGVMLTNESVCEIIQSCFRICFEGRLSELLRRSAEHTLMDMVQVLFSRLPQFNEDPKWAVNMKKMRASGFDSSRTNKHKKKSPKLKPKKPSPPSSLPTRETAEVAAPSVAVVPPGGDEGQRQEEDEEEELGLSEVLATTPVAGGGTVVDIQNSLQCTPVESDDAPEGPPSRSTGQDAAPDTAERSASPDRLDSGQGLLDEGPDDVVKETLSAGPSYEDLQKLESEPEMISDVEKLDMSSDPTDAPDHTALVTVGADGPPGVSGVEYVNPRGVRFTPHQRGGSDVCAPLLPYGLPCVRELFRFLVSLTNPFDRHNTDTMVNIGLSLLTVALESGADHIATFNSLLALVKDDMCKNLFFLLQSERLSLFAAAIRVCFLLFECMRSHLKFQLEMYLNKLTAVITSESSRPVIAYEHREVALESLVQLLRVPGLVTELYLNFDCDYYSSSVFEDLMKLLSKNAFPFEGVFSTHLLSLDALLTVIDSIEKHCHHRGAQAAGLCPPPHPTPHPPPNPTTNTPEFNGSVACVEEATDGSNTHVLQPPGLSAPEHTSSSPGSETDTAVKTQLSSATRSSPKMRPNRMKTSAVIPSEEELAAVKLKKKLYQSGTEQFNVKPARGMRFLQEHGLLATPLDPRQVALYIKQNPKLDKKMIGEFISSKENGKIFEAFHNEFVFEEVRLDEALRVYLESFRLPGEAPVIHYILEHFSEHWHKSNGEPFVNADAAFTLAYAIIILNVDQHNSNAKKQNVPMTREQFKKNLKAVNGGGDFDQDMLDEIYTAIKNEEIVMPEEQTGLVRENYLWKLLLRRGSSKEGVFLHVPSGMFDRDLFAIVWGPTVAALSFVFDKSSNETFIQKAISGFRKCALISAHYAMSDVFDNLVISLCKFTTLLSAVESADNVAVVFGYNMKAQLAARTVFGLAHRHGDILRDGWRNILDCMLLLYRAKLLPDLLIYVEDFIAPNGKISLIREEAPATQRSESNVLSSLYSYLTLADSVPARGPSPRDQEAVKASHRCISDCHVDQLMSESRFLRAESLHELLKALMFASRCPEVQEAMTGSVCDEDSAVFFLELLIKVVLQNRDRIGAFWQAIRDHIYSLVVNSSDHAFLVERAVVGLLRLAIRLLRRDEIAPQVLSSLRMLLLMPPARLRAVSPQLAFGLHELLKTNAANIHTASDWYALFTLLEVSGAGSNPPPLLQVHAGVNVPESIADAGAQSDSEVVSGGQSACAASDRGYTSDSEVYENRHSRPVDVDVKPTSHGSWLLVYNNSQRDTEAAAAAADARQAAPPSRGGGGHGGGQEGSSPVNPYSLELGDVLQCHDTRSLTKSCETLAFLVRDAAHITPHNFESCVHTIRTFVEASLNGGHSLRHAHKKAVSHAKEKKAAARRRIRHEESLMKKSRSSPSHLHHIDDSDDDSDTDGYHSLSIQLLDLMHTLHTRAAGIYGSWAEEGRRRRRQGGEEGGGGEEGEGGEAMDTASSSLWLKCWCPLLQGIARMCCDSRKQIRSQALTYLQRALLVHDLQTLSAMEWENCFNKVLFPLLSKLLENINVNDPNGIEETRMRASALLCKVFLQHLSPLLSLSTFTALWLTILDFMDRYMNVDKRDLLCEAIPESLKNMLLVMHTASILQPPSASPSPSPCPSHSPCRSPSPSPSESPETQLWQLTWDRINAFLPSLQHDLFKPHQRGKKPLPIHETCAPEETGAATTQLQPASPVTSLATSPVTSPVTSPPSVTRVRNGLGEEAERPAVVVEERSASPLTIPHMPPAAGHYVLHPPLPSVTNSPKGFIPPVTSVPLLLNPDIMHGTPIPIISPQNSPGRRTPEVRE